MKPANALLSSMAVTLALAGCSAPTGRPAASSLPSATAVSDTARDLDLGPLVTVADGEHLASTYGDNVLSAASDGVRDLLSTVRVEDGRAVTAEVEVSNSVAAPPEVVDVSPDGDTAYVVKRLGQRSAGDTTVAQLTPGTRLTEVDLSDPASPAVRGHATVSPRPEGLDVSPAGDLVAVVSNSDAGSIIELVPTGPDGLGEQTRPQRFDLSTLGVTEKSGDLVTAVQWHPSGRYVAVNVTSRNRVAFLQVRRGAGGKQTLQLRGAPVTTGSDPFVGRFTPDGRYYLTANWGRDLGAGDLSGRLPDVPSQVGVIRLGSATATHEALGAVDTDVSSEGIAISPDGTLVATVNMRGSLLPAGSPGYTDRASVSLLRLDPADGGLVRVANVALDGVLPEGGTFDSTGRYFVATVFSGRAGSDAGPGLQVYRVDDGGTGLTPVSRIELSHGVHHVVHPAAVTPTCWSECRRHRVDPVGAPMNRSTPDEFARLYLTAWSTKDRAERRRLIDRVYDEEAGSSPTSLVTTPSSARGGRRSWPTSARSTND